MIVVFVVKLNCLFLIYSSYFTKKLVYLYETFEIKDVHVVFNQFEANSSLIKNKQQVMCIVVVVVKCKITQ